MVKIMERGRERAFCWTLSGTENTILSDTVLQSILLDTERGGGGRREGGEERKKLTSVPLLATNLLR